MRKEPDEVPFVRKSGSHRDFPFDSTTMEFDNLIRNAVAHQSRSARNKFEAEVIGAAPVLPVERTPAGYLRTVCPHGPGSDPL
jgi:hypothetical protein